MSFVKVSSWLLVISCCFLIRPSTSKSLYTNQVESPQSKLGFERTVIKPKKSDSDSLKSIQLNDKMISGELTEFLNFAKWLLWMERTGNISYFDKNREIHKINRKLHQCSGRNVYSCVYGKSKEGKLFRRSVHAKLKDQKQFRHSVYAKLEGEKRFKHSVYAKSEEKRFNHSVYAKLEREKRFKGSVHAKSEKEKRFKRSVYAKSEEKRFNHSVCAKSEEENLFKRSVYTKSKEEKRFIHSVYAKSKLGTRSKRSLFTNGVHKLLRKFLIPSITRDLGVMIYFLHYLALFPFYVPNIPIFQDSGSPDDEIYSPIQDFQVFDVFEDFVPYRYYNKY